VNVAVQLEPPVGAPPDVQYRWDTDTDILTARIANHDGNAAGSSGSVELEGADGSWLILDVLRGCIAGIEIAVWPDVHKSPSLVPPGAVEDAHVVVPPVTFEPGAATLEVETPIRAEADDAERVIYFRVGTRRGVRTVRLARDLLLDVDPQCRIAGLWLLNVPPFPSLSPST
jgi:hypothetical protein